MKITYNDKSYLNQNLDIPDVNKVNDTDLNEIKNVVNSNYDEFIDELYYKPGDVIEIGNATLGTVNSYILSGFISNASRTLLFTLPLPKKLDNITTITINNATLEGRSVDGYLNNTVGYVEYVGTSGYSFTVERTLNHSSALTIGITKSTAFTKSGGGSITNNTPIEVNGYFKFTLS
jgi:hypothetical protein